MASPVYTFGEFRLDSGQFALTRDGHPVRMERKPLDLLLLFASSQGRLVTRAEIAQCLWGKEVFVDTEHGINTAIRKVRYALRESAESSRFLETVTGKGYRFTGAVAEPQPDTAPQVAVMKTPIAVFPESPHPAWPARQAVSRRGRALSAATVIVAFLTIVTLLTAGARRVSRPVASPHIDPVAIEAYQHGRFLWFSNRQEASGAYFLRATQVAPSYAPAWAGLANYYGAQIVNGKLDPRQNLPLQDAAAHRASQLDGSLPETGIALAAAYWLVGWDYPAALRELDHAIELNPKSSEAHHLRWKLLAQLDHPDEALAEQRLSMELDPLERPWELVNALFLARRYDAAITEARLRLEGSPSSKVWSILSRAYAAKGMQEESEEAREQGLILSGEHAAAASIHQAFQRGGHRAVTLWLLADLNAQSRDHYVSPYRFASLYANLGEREQALDALEEAVRQHSPLILDVQNDFIFDEIHTDPRYRAIIQRIGLPPSW